MAIMLNLVWFRIGSTTRSLGLGPRGERALNLAMGGTIIGAAILSLASPWEGVLAPHFNGVSG